MQAVCLCFLFATAAVALPVFENEDDISAVTSAENLQVVDLAEPEEDKIDDPILSAVQVETKVQATSPAQWLAYHNKYRCMQGLNDLRWSDGLAAAAQRWASGGKWGHGTGSDSPYQQTPPGGENLGAGGDAEGTVGRWYAEIKDCDWSTGCQKPTTVGKMVGHFTAMAWKNTNTLGCATATITEGNMKGYPYFVCRYGDTPPNYGGQYKTNVNRAVKSASQCVSGGGGGGDGGVTPPTPPACEDQNPNCAGWKDRYCPNQGNEGHPYVIKNCKRTCGLCGRAVPVPVPIPVTRAPVPPTTRAPVPPTTRAPVPPTTRSPVSSGGSGKGPTCGGSTKFVPKCGNCVSSSQCQTGSCCPYMRKCVGQGTRCYPPIADCRPSCYTANCGTCANKDYPNNWVKCAGNSVVTPPASPSSCVDKRAGNGCGIWKGRGYCTSGRYVSFMASNCAKTCGKC